MSGGYMHFVGHFHSGDPDKQWIRWLPDMPGADDLRDAIQAFEPVDNPAGRRCAQWLRDEALDNHPSTVTHLLVRNGRLEAFFALCAGAVKLSQRHRRDLRAGDRAHELHVIQPAALITWIARDRSSEVHGAEILAQAAATALDVVDVGQGQIALTLNGFDEETEQLWMKRYGFRRSQPLEGHHCLWRSLKQSSGR
jgi:hypothetical protein